MGELTLDRTQTTSVETILEDELARETRALRGVAPVVAHMLESAGQPLVNDAVVARLRGMLNSIAAQLLRGGAPSGQLSLVDSQAVDALVDALAQDNALLNHLYALSVEGQLTLDLERNSTIDPVLSPLLQELIASDQPEIAELAMTTLAAQSRFMQSQRRMEHSINELPPELFANAISALRKGRSQWGGDDASIDALKSSYDEAAGRLGLLARLVSSMQSGAVAGLELGHAGTFLFASSLSALSGLSRDLSVLSCLDRQATRLAIALRATGLEDGAIERQFALIGLRHLLPSALTNISQAKAQRLLAAHYEGTDR